MSEIIIPQNEYGKLRVFTLSLPDDAAERLNDSPHALQDALGTNSVDPDHVDVFQISDLGTLGLAGYLREGSDAIEAEITRDAAKLAAIEGWVMLVYSAAFGRAKAALDPIPELTLIGTYSQQPADTATIPLESDAAAPYTGVPSMTPPTPPKGRAGGSLIVVGLVVLTALLLWWVFG